MQSWTPSPVPDLPTTAPERAEIRVRNTATGDLRIAGGPERASLYVCGITPYDATHLGHANTYLTFDLLVRVWRDAGYEVAYTQNVTDIDDPLLERANATGEDWRSLAERETQLFREDMAALRILPPTSFRGAVETIPQVVEAVERMVADGVAYRVGPDADGVGEGDVYADLSRDPHFGRDTGTTDRVSNLREFAQMGGDPERVGKRDALDPLLWRTARAGEPSWDGGDLGAGRPGWHIECATIGAMTLGAPFDVQGGGKDLRFPHHAMSSSHLRELTATPWPVRQHVHAGLVAFEGHKISKSRGNLVLISRLRADGVDPMVIRLALLAHHYAEDWEFTYPDLLDAAARAEAWRQALATIERERGTSERARGQAADLLERMRRALANDLDAPAALAAVDAWATQVDPDEADPEAARLVRDAVDALVGVKL